MRISTIKDETTVDELIDRVQGAGASKTKAVREAFLAANPHLADFERLPRGTPVVVPDETEEEAPVAGERHRNAVTQVAHAIALTRAGLDTGIARENDRAKESRQALTDPAFLKAVQANPEIDQLRAAALQAIDAQETEFAGTRQAIDSVLAGFEDVLKKLTPPAPPPPPEPEPEPEPKPEPKPEPEPDKPPGGGRGKGRAVGKGLKKTEKSG